MVNVVFRTDSSIAIGTGHVMRCLTLADHLSPNGAKVSFISRCLTGNINDYIRHRGYEVYTVDASDVGASIIPDKATDYPDIVFDWESDYISTREIVTQLNNQIDLLVVDHYSIDERWEAKLRPYAKKIMVIDDLADRSHDCDILLDQNLYDGMDNRYDQLIPYGCVKFLGPEYVLLRNEFLGICTSVNCVNNSADDSAFRLFVFFGGSDPTGETLKTIDAIKMIDSSKIAVNIIAGSSNVNKTRIQQLCSEMSDVNYYEQVENIAEFMAEADLAIGGGGTTSWERCYLGLPAIAIAVAENQVEIIKTLEKAGALWSLGWHENVNSQNIANAIEYALKNQIELRSMSERAKELMSGLFDWDKLLMDYVL